MSQKLSADRALVAAGLAATRERAQAMIMAGQIFIGETRVEKAGTIISADAVLEVRGPRHPWVSRGGMKLAHGLDHFAISARGKTCLDIGSSTGGFTDVLLTNGAARVYAVDVGHGQLDWGLRNDDRVCVRERTNARRLSAEQIPDLIDLVVCDASFIGLQTILPTPLSLTAPKADLIALIKPQFEVEKSDVGKGGVVRDPALHDASCDKIRTWLDAMENWQVTGLTKSPITGPKGNIEFLIAARRET